MFIDKLDYSKRKWAIIGNNNHNYINCFMKLHFRWLSVSVVYFALSTKDQHAIFNLGLNFSLPVNNQRTSESERDKNCWN